MESRFRDLKVYYVKCDLFDVDVLENLYEWEKMTIADALEAITFDDGDIIVKEGDDGEDFFIIVDGSENLN